MLEITESETHCTSFFVFCSVNLAMTHSYQGQTSETEKLSGHIPTSVNYPYYRLVNPETGTLNDPQALLDFLKSKHISLADEIVCMSETGVDAAVLFLALTVAGKTSNLKLYNGGFLEWANTRDCPTRTYY